MYVLVRPQAANTRYDLEALARSPNVTLFRMRGDPLGLWQHAGLRNWARELALDVFHRPTYSVPLLMPCPVVSLSTT